MIKLLVLLAVLLVLSVSPAKAGFLHRLFKVVTAPIRAFNDSAEDFVQCLDMGNKYGWH